LKFIPALIRSSEPAVQARRNLKPMSPVASFWPPCTNTVTALGVGGPPSARPVTSNSENNLSPTSRPPAGKELTDTKSPVKGTHAACAELASKILIDMIEKNNADFIVFLRFLFIMSPIPYFSMHRSIVKYKGCRVYIHSCTLSDITNFTVGTVKKSTKKGNIFSFFRFFFKKGGFFNKKQLLSAKKLNLPGLWFSKRKNM
jgi:hypothetical protein